MKLYRLIIIIAMALCLALGFWQLRRAEFKQQLQNKKIMPVHITGQFDNAHQILLDNKVNKGRVGYEVITPLVPSTAGSIVLVNRGWIPRGVKREQLPTIKSIDGVQTIVGYPKTPETKIFRLGANIESATWPLRIQQLDQEGMAQVAKQLGKPIAPTILSLSAPKPSPTSPSKHRGYAVQWFLLAGVLVIFLVIHVRKK